MYWSCKQYKHYIATNTQFNSAYYNAKERGPEHAL
jgi:hypothetical protein